MNVLVPVLIALAVVIGAMVACGDLRVTRKQQRDWEEEWASLTPGERGWRGYLTHHMPGYGREMTRADFGP